MIEEIWKDIKGYEGHYQASTLGKIRSLKNNITLKPGACFGGYLKVSLSKENRVWNVKVHRIIALTFLPIKSSENIVNHINGDRLDNSISNLEWCTPSHNVINGFLRGRDVKGSKNNFSKLTTEQVEQIIALRNTLSKTKIGIMFGVSRALIGMIHNGKVWKHVNIAAL